MKAEAPIPFNHQLRQHPDLRKLIVDPDYYWRPMLASVSRPSTVAGQAAALRRTIEETHSEVRQLRSEVRELRRSLAGLQAQRAGSDDGLQSQSSRPRIEIPPSVRRSRRVTR